MRLSHKLTSPLLLVVVAFLPALASLATTSAAFTQVRKQIASDGAENDQFGNAAGISGDTIVVGARGDDSLKGSAYIYTRNKGGPDLWGEVKRLVASDGAASDQFGWSVAISGDTVVVGMPGDDSLRGAAYVFERNKGGADNWGEVKKLTASDGASSDQFGLTVGISGNMIIVGAYGDEIQRGGAYLFERNRGGAENWGEVKKLTGSDGVRFDVFGYFVGISVDTVVVGAWGDDSLKGSAYIFERNKGGADNWGEVKKLIATDGAADDRFGITVGISVDTIAVGATADDTFKGSAYIYERNKGGADNWGEVKKLTASDGAANDSFGAVGISGDTVVVGAAGDDSGKGSAYIYERNKGGADNWGEGRKLTASDGAEGDRFGVSVGISGNAVVMGARGDDGFKGAAYTFVSQGNQWVEQRKPTASDGTASDAFGNAAGISGDTIVVGARGDDSLKGSAYIYTRNKGGPDLWGEVKRLMASDGAASDQFGWSVAISGDTVVVGMPGDESLRGAAYVFERNKGGADNWGEVKKLTASDGASSDQFGLTVGISGNMIIVGAYGDEIQRGGAYLFERNRGGAENWGEVKKLTGSDGVRFDVFGYFVGISVDTVVVGAWGDDSLKGSAYIFERNKGGADNWGEVKKLIATDGAADDRFGITVGISVDTVAIGATGDDTFKGSAYIYERNKGGADNWGEVKKLTASDGAANDSFGAVGVSGDTVVVGAAGDDSGKGSAYIYERNKGGTDNWGEVSKVTASDGASNDFFGLSIRISDDTIVAGARGDDSGKGSAYVFTVFPEAVNVSAANFQRSALAPEMIAAAFGIDLATGTETAATIPLPTNLHGTTISVKDSAGSERSAQLFFVSPGQVNYYIPAGTSLGPAAVKITTGSGQISFGTVEIATTSPGFFSANSTGQGIAAALALRVRGAQQSYEEISRFDAVTNSFVAIPVDLGPPGDQVFLVMFGTGFRFRSSESGVGVKVGGRALQSLFSGAAGSFVGLDQMNISPLPRELAGAGVVNIEIMVDGKAANATTVSIR